MVALQSRKRHWFLVFDNSDNIQLVLIMQYFSLVPWGHVTITSRAKGGIGKAGLHLEELGKTDSTEVLLVKAGAYNPSAADWEDARAIAELL